MPSREEMAVVREFVRRHCAISTDPHGNEKAQDTGYFRFDVGPTARKARKGAAANVPWGEPDASYAAVDARLRMLFRDGAPRVWVRAVGTNDTSPIDSIDLYGDPGEAESDDDDDDGKRPRGRYALVEGHANTVATLTRLTERLVDRVIGQTEETRALAVRAEVFELVATARQDASTAESVRALTSALGPGVSASIPLVVAAMLKSYGFDPNAAGPAAVDAGAPPGEQVDRLTDQVESLFTRIVALCVANPDLVTEARVGRWRDLVARTFGGGQTPPAPSDDIDPPDPDAVAP